MKKVSVIGAGFAGMTVALRLAQKGFEVDLYESASRVGGLIGTEKTSYGIAERAANSFLRTGPILDLFQDIGLEPVGAMQFAKKRFIFRHIPKQWPLTVTESLGFIAKLLSRILRGKKYLRPQAHETLAAWGHRILGKSATTYILSPAMQGIYGNAADELSASLILGPLFAPRKKGKYKGIISATGGMQKVIDHLHASLEKHGVRIHLNSKVSVEELQGPVVVATSASAACNILQNSHPDIAKILSDIRMSSIMSVTVFFKKPQTTFQGFGCLIPRPFGLRALGILMNSYIFPGRNGTYNETWIFGGVNSQNLLDLADADILKVIAEERFRILGSKENLVDYRIFRWPHALPFYDLHLEKALEKLLGHSPAKDIFLHGNYLGGIGLSRILERSNQLADEIASRYV